MANVMTLLDLPKTSKGFTALKPITIQVDGSATPPRKLARLENDSDVSASRSISQTDGRSGTPIVLEVQGDPLDSESEGIWTGYFNNIRYCIRTILTRGASENLPLSYEEIYTACRFLVCISNKGEGLYETFKMEMEQSLSRLATELLVTEKRTGIKWINAFVEGCKWFEQQVGLLKSWLTYLDRVYVLQNRHLKSVHDQSFLMFADMIFSNAQTTLRLRSGINDWVTAERESQQDHKSRDTIRTLISHLSTHSQYVSIFETYYLDLTKSFYAAESLKYEVKGKARKFLSHCMLRESEEDARAAYVLPERSRAAVNETTEQALLDGRLVWLAEEGIEMLMKDQRDGSLDDLRSMYGQFSRNGGLKILCAHFKSYVQSAVQSIVKDTARDDEMVQRLLDFKAYADKAASKSFVDSIPTPPVGTSAQADTIPNKEFGYALIDAFQTAFLVRPTKPAEMIAKYLDKLMRRGQKDASDSEFEAILDGVLGLYRFTRDKDVFRVFYQRALAKRLLLERSASDDFEKGMLKKFKEQFDPEFGMGDKMFTDLALSRDTMNAFLAGKEPDHPARKLSVMVLQQSVWPFTSRKKNVDLPPSMQDQLTEYAAFYKGRHQGHKIEWDHALGTATLKARFIAGQKELSVSLHQCIVLLLFNDSAELSFTDIKEQTRMDDNELIRTLQSLALGNKRVLKKQTLGKDIVETDIFHFNADFTDARQKIHINSIQVKETAEENRKTQSSIEGDRKHYLDAAIVRIMKARKELPYEQLKAATIDAVKNHFVPEVSVIKQRIAGLVEQDYLARDEDDMNLFTYVA